jgi:hypothetical protein
MPVLPEIPDEVCASAQRLTQSVLQIAELLGLSRAELSRVLHLRCGDTARLAAVRQTLVPDTPAWRQALELVRFYRTLHGKMRGDEAGMWRWLRTSHRELDEVPLLLLVDHDRLAEVTRLLVRDQGVGKRAAPEAAK